ncbi:BRCT domain-containing protein [Schizosaccharomyces cryophilus OY26]|uniref:BRCT domain-containing protein n=1 Tax=Schizosaccharomyces cryophilus (strain OY26 / ATCC MYA-4695 / CBS 11777 / NBRC 106824 / NRRL Y48691) TaxID=653667 RepID=S9X747_SCHCR|nr:BRCT domain-containing protein [Schizosaccharomyces cryophilus OY26]EPY52907.1 BRCT domain-containing protein [Schizosaccharomyces cryophilus OY26]
MLSLESKQDVLPNPRMHRKGHYRRHSLHSLQSLKFNTEPISKQLLTVPDVNTSHRRHERVNSLDGASFPAKPFGDASRASNKVTHPSIPFASSKYLFPIGRDSPPKDSYFSAITEEQLEDAYADFWKPTVSLSLSSKSIHDMSVSTQVVSKIKDQGPLSSASVCVRIEKSLLDHNCLVRQLVELGATIHQKPQFSKQKPTTHMVLPKNSTLNLVLDTVSSESTINFVSPEWVLACYSTKKWVDESSFRMNFKHSIPRNILTSSKAMPARSQISRMKKESDPSLQNLDVLSRHNPKTSSNKPGGIEYVLNPSFAENVRLVKEKSMSHLNATSHNVASTRKRLSVRDGVFRFQETGTWIMDSPFSPSKLSKLSPRQRKQLESAKKKYLAYEPIVGSPLKQKIPFFDL